MKRSFKKLNFLVIIALLIYVSYIFVIQEIEYKKYQQLKVSYLAQIEIANAKTEEEKS